MYPSATCTSPRLDLIRKAPSDQRIVFRPALDDLEPFRADELVEVENEPAAKELRITYGKASGDGIFFQQNRFETNLKQVLNPFMPAVNFECRFHELTHADGEIGLRCFNQQ